MWVKYMDLVTRGVMAHAVDSVSGKGMTWFVLPMLRMGLIY